MLLLNLQGKVVLLGPDVGILPSIVIGLRGLGSSEADVQDGD